MTSKPMRTVLGMAPRTMPGPDLDDVLDPDVIAVVLERLDRLNSPSARSTAARIRRAQKAGSRKVE